VGLVAFCQAIGKHDSAARRLSNAAVFQAVLCGIPLALADFTVMWTLVYLMTSLVELVLVPISASIGTTLACLAALILLPVASLAGLYPALGQSPIVEFRQLARAATLSLVACAAIGVVCFPEAALGYITVAALSFVVCLPLLPASRFVIRSLFTQLGIWGAPILIYAEPRRALHLYRQLKAMPERGLRPVGILLNPEAYWSDEHELADAPLCDVRDTLECALQHRATWVLIGSENSTPAPADDAVTHALWAIPNRILLSSAQLEVGMWDQMQTIGPACGVRLAGACPDSFRQTAKRLFDIVASIALLVLTAPFFLLVALAIRLTSPGPVFYAQTRVGLSGRPFRAWKFRTMRPDADALLATYLDNNPDFRAQWNNNRKLARDPRVTSIGRLLRITSMDELPQLWNVLIGDMSLVGPRPLVDSPLFDRIYIDDHPLEFAAYKSVRPGLTGLWQVTCRNNGVYSLRIYWDMYYIRNWSLWLDVYILFRTIRTVLLCEGAQ
jgi:Undecaprenyl-phosphate galactose phosphotransferase WbaP